MWQVLLTRQAAKDAINIKSSGLKAKAEKLFKVLAENPYQNPPEYEKLGGDLEGFYARRINKQHRLVYEILKETRQVRIIRMWTHYE
jgi:toxin YoeB